MDFPKQAVFASAEGLAADLRPYQQRLMVLAQEILVGSDDAVWRIAAPTACAIVSSLGEDKKICRHAEL